MSLVDLDWLAALTPEGEGTVTLRAAVCRQLVAEMREMRRALWTAVLDPTHDTAPLLTDDDRRVLTTIREAMEAGDTSRYVRLIQSYYRDADRADRTPRSILYMHLGLLLALCVQATDAPETPSTH